MENGYNATLGGDGKKLYTEEDYELIIKKYSEIKSATELSKCLNISADTIRKILHDKNVKVLPIGESTKIKTSKKVKYTSINSNNILGIFDSVNDCARYLIENKIASGKINGIARHISQNCRGERNSAYGYIWQFID